jgi:EmrB/QacA subfamily drug resistance transporter
MSGMNDIEGAPLALSAGRRRAVTAGIMTGMALAALEATVVGAAMPTVVAALGGLDHYSWVFSAYIVPATVTVPLWGKLSDIYGRRRLYQIGIAIFLLGSALCGAAGTMAQLVGFRAVQGLGAGALIPLGMTIVGDIYTLEERARVQAYFSGVWGLSSVIGPFLGGFLTEHVSWRSVFYVNLPVGILAAAIIGLALRGERRHARPAIDWAGAALLTSSLSCLMLALVGTSDARALLEPGRLALLAASAALGVLFVRAERRAADPIVPLDLFADPVIAAAVLAGFFAGMGMFGAISYVPLYAQGVRGTGPTGAGLSLAPLMLGWVVFSVVGGRLLLRFGYRPTTLSGLALMTAGFTLLSLLPRQAAPIWLHAELMVVGAGLGLTMLTLLIAVQQAAPRPRLGVATSVNQLARSVGGAIGVAVMGVALALGLAARTRGLGAVDPAALVEPASRAALDPATRAVLQDALAGALRSVFGLAGALSAVAFGVAYAWLPRAARPPAEACTPETGERMVMAELATIDPEHEPEAVR